MGFAIYGEEIGEISGNPEFDAARAIWGKEWRLPTEEEIKELLKKALTDKINDRTVYMKGIDMSYRYEGYNTYSMKELDK